MWSIDVYNHSHIIDTDEVVECMFVFVTAVVCVVELTWSLYLTVCAIKYRHSFSAHTHSTIQQFPLLTARPYNQIVQHEIDTECDVVDDTVDGCTV